MTAVAPHLVEEDLGVEVRPVDVAGVQGLRQLLGLSFLIQPVVELQHAVHPALPAAVLRRRHRAVRLGVHTELRPADKRTNETTINTDDERPASRRGN